jgi:hypothetical protein
MYFSTGNEGAFSTTPASCLVRVSENAHVQIIRRFERKSSFNQFSYWDFAQKRAVVGFIKIQNDTTANLIDTYVSQQEEVV